ncbi:zinc-ribbon domain protein [Candidatus Tiddalikarchaeum anstoanum]|nr:zinc-ribbon domain protein [Candidatus Tiddalikarchaeum anstoanum]
MFCEDCGKEIKDNAKFCKYCGAKVVVEEKPEEVVREEAAPESKPKKSKFLLILGLLLLLVLFLLLYLYLRNQIFGTIFVILAIILLINIFSKEKVRTLPPKTARKKGEQRVVDTNINLNINTNEAKKPKGNFLLNLKS